MFRKSILVLLITLLVIAGNVSAQQPPPPQGFYNALSDLSTRLGKSFSMTCSDPNEGSSCVMSDPALSWSWSESLYGDDSLGCPFAPVNAAGQRRGYQFIFTYLSQAYDYRQDQSTGNLFLCVEGGTPGDGGSAAPGGQDFSECAGQIPSLTVDTLARVTDGGQPNNVRAEPGEGAALVGQIPPLSVFSVTGGPECASGMFWWQINANGMVGWTAQGQNSSWVEAQPFANPVTPLNVNNVSQMKVLYGRGIGYSAPTQITFSATNQLLVAGDGIGLYDMTGTNPGGLTSVGPEGLSSSGILAITINHPDGQETVATSELNEAFNGGTLRLFQMLPPPGNQPSPLMLDQGTLTFPSGQANWLALNLTGSLLAVGLNDNGVPSGFHVDVYDVTTLRELTVLSQNAPPNGLAFNTDATQFIVMTSDGLVSVYNTSAYELVNSFGAFGYDPEAQANANWGIAAMMQLSSDGKSLAVLSFDRASSSSVIDVLDVATGTSKWQFKLPADNNFGLAIRDISFSADSALLAYAYGTANLPDGGFAVLDAATGTKLFDQPGGASNRVIFDTAGRLHVIAEAGAAGQTWTVWGVQ